VRRDGGRPGASSPEPADDPAPADDSADVLADDTDLVADAELAAELAAELESRLDPPDDGHRLRRFLLLGLRFLISAVMVWFLVHKIADSSFADLVPEWTFSTAAWFVLAWGLTVFGIVLSAARWQRVLTGMDVARPPFRRLLSHYFAGQFVANVLPTTIGGDVLRGARLARDTGDPADSFASVIIERLTGWFVLPLLTAAGMLASPAARSLGPATTLAVAIAAGTLVALLVILFAADHPRLGGRFARRQDWRRFIGAVHLGVARIRRHPRATVRIIAVGTAYQLTLVAAAAAAARMLGIDGAGFTVLLAFFPAVLAAQVLPIGISGLGVREGALVIFLSPLGVPDDQAVALGLVVFVLNLLASLLGAPAFLTGARSRPPRMPSPTNPLP
jgi:glycosyltransferase 2 family protein